MFLFTFMLTILCFTYHLSHLFWVTFPWPGHTPHWNPVLMINVCYTLMMVTTEMLIIHAKDRPALLLDKL